MKAFSSYLLLLITILLFACNEVEKVQKSKDFNYKLSKANEYYDKKRYNDAVLLYEELLTVYKGTKNFEDIYYRYTTCFFYNKDYLQASYHFKNFVDIFPGSNRAEECSFLHCKCLYMMSPAENLDQSSTIKAMSAMQAFLNNYPQSTHAAECTNLIDAALKKIEQKDEINAYLYYKIGEYKSSSIAYKEMVKKYPDSEKNDYYHYMIIKSLFNFANSSILSKQSERYNQVLSDYADFKTNHPKSKYLKEAEYIQRQSQAFLVKIEEQIKKQQ